MGGESGAEVKGRMDTGCGGRLSGLYRSEASLGDQREDVWSWVSGDEVAGL